MAADRRARAVANPEAYDHPESVKKCGYEFRETTSWRSVWPETDTPSAVRAPFVRTMLAAFVELMAEERGARGQP